MRCTPITARLVRAPHRLAAHADVTELCRRIQCSPTAHDLVVDLSQVDSLEPQPARTLRDHLLWRLHWSRVGVIAGRHVDDVLTRLHLRGPVVIAPTFAEVVDGLARDDRTPPGGRLLLMGPGPAHSVEKSSSTRRHPPI